MVTHEERINKEKGNCEYKEINRANGVVIWERACEDHDIDFVVGIFWKRGDMPKPEDFNATKSRNIALRYTIREDAASYYFAKTGITV